MFASDEAHENFSILDMTDYVPAILALTGVASCIFGLLGALVGSLRAAMILIAIGGMLIGSGLALRLFLSINVLS